MKTVVVKNNRKVILTSITLLLIFQIIELIYYCFYSDFNILEGNILISTLNLCVFVFLEFVILFIIYFNKTASLKGFFLEFVLLLIKILFVPPLVLVCHAIASASL